MTKYTGQDRNDPTYHARLDAIQGKRWNQITEDDYQWWSAQDFCMRPHTEIYAYMAVRGFAQSNQQIGHLARRNKELNKDLDTVWDYYHNHYDECPTSRDNIVAKICRFILRHT